MNSYNQVTNIIRARRTFKVIGDPVSPVTFSNEALKQYDAIVGESIETAGLAPFHYDRGVEQIAEPWRVHLLSAQKCREVAAGLPGWCELKPNNKLPAMLSACGCVVLVTWLPQFRENQTAVTDIAFEKQIEIDDEHLAATSALVQNLLLLLTAAELGTYWSSGGQLGSSEVFQRLKIPVTERLLAAVFVEYPCDGGEVLERLPGKNHELRSPVSRWLRQV